MGQIIIEFALVEKIHISQWRQIASFVMVLFELKFPPILFVNN